MPPKDGEAFADGAAAIKSNIDALKRIVASLAGMAGLTVSGPCSGDGAVPPCELRPTLPRHLRLAILRLAILRLLRPAESAARRLIIAAARGLVISSPRPRKIVPKPACQEPALRRFGIAVVLSPDAAGIAAVRPTPAVCASPSRRLALPLFDPPRRFASHQRRVVPAHAAPRILFPGFAEPHKLPPPPSPDDRVDAKRMGRRIACLAAALEDLPAQARRFARWKARQHAAARTQSHRISPLRPGMPPGGRLVRFDPMALRRNSVREIDEVLAHAHALALYALHYPDTS